MKEYKVYNAIQQMKERGFRKDAVARQLDINWRTVDRYWNMTADEYETHVHNQQRASQLDIYQNQMLIWLRQYPAMTASQVCDWLKENYKANFKERTVSRYVKALREEYGLKKTSDPRDYEAVPELPMGQQVQVDFGQKLMPNVDGGQTKVYAAVFLLARSRYKYAEMQSRPFTSTDLVRLCHNCFQYFGGMPQEMVFDQDSILCVSENAGDIIYTYEFEKFRQETRISIYLCRGADPESKGKIENAVKYIKGNFLSNRMFVDDSILNGSCLEWLDRTANAKEHGTTKLIPAEVFKEEREHLRPLIGLDAASRPLVCRTVRKDNTILFNSNRYSVPLGIYNSQPEVRLETLDGILYIQTLFGEPICEHRIAGGRGLLIQNKSHTRDRTTALDKLQDDLDALLEGKATDFLEAIRSEKTRYSRDQFKIIQSLIDQHGVSDVLEGITFCMSNTLHSANILKDFLTHKMKTKGKTEQPVSVVTAIPVDNLKYHVTTQKRPLEVYAKVGVR
jgi:transposase